jgi:threonine dehydrogenase-like Zn-dependent dehydrogenase
MIVRKHVQLLGSWASTTEDLRRAVDLMASGQVSRRMLVSHEFALDDAAEAFAFQEQGQAIKVVVKP